VISAVTLVLYALATQGWMVYPALALSIFGWTLGAPALQAILSRFVPGNEQGLLQGAVGSVTSATNIVGPPLWTGLFAFFVGSSAPLVLPGAAFLVAGVVLLVALALRAFATPAGANATDGVPLPNALS
jgi:DHA1 family tetracycline resistance protein-like MFS transporter